MLRDPIHTLAVAAALRKKLGTEVSVIQTPRLTSWNVGDKCFAIGPLITSYPLQKLVDRLVVYFTPKAPPKPLPKDDDDTANHTIRKPRGSKGR